MRYRLVLISFIFVAFFVSCKNQRNAPTVETPIDTIPVLLTQLQNTSKLYTVEYQLHKIITHKDTKQLQGSIMDRNFNITLPMSQRLIAMPMDATVKAYVDFAELGADNIRRSGNKVEIILPDPHIIITSTRISHKDVKQYVDIARSDFSDAELLSFEKQGRRQIEQAIPQLGITEQARESAARVLIPLIMQMGFSESDIVITFRKQFTLKDYPVLIDKKMER